MLRFALAAILVALAPALAAAATISGDYMESRTCDIYTGPCFANGQVGLTGKEAILAWSVRQGQFEGVDLSGLKVIVAIQAADTLGFGGGLKVNPYPIRSVVIVDELANQKQRDALVSFARHQAAKVIGDTTRVVSSPIEMNVDHFRQSSKLAAGKWVSLETRKLGSGDCVCTNEMVFYPPLVELRDYRPAYTLVGGYAGPGLGSQWTNPNTRSAFTATFAY